MERTDSVQLLIVITAHELATNNIMSYVYNF